MADSATKWSYDRWIDEQHAKISAELDALFRKQGYLSTLAVFAVPSAGAKQGELVVSDESMPGCDVIAFPSQGTNVSAVPRSHLRALLWSACRRAPICPTE